MKQDLQLGIFLIFNYEGVSVVHKGAKGRVIRENRAPVTATDVASSDTRLLDASYWRSFVLMYLAIRFWSHNLEKAKLQSRIQIQMMTEQYIEVRPSAFEIMKDPCRSKVVAIVFLTDTTCSL